jgi:hypothetical protein
VNTTADLGADDVACASSAGATMIQHPATSARVERDRAREYPIIVESCRRP